MADTTGSSARADGTPRRVAPIELFFDLVYVLAVTQLTHQLLDAPHRCAAPWRRSCCSSPSGRPGCTPAWITSWFDPSDAARAADARRRDAREPAHVRGDPGGVRRPRAGVRGRLRRHPGRTNRSGCSPSSGADHDLTRELPAACSSGCSASASSGSPARWPTATPASRSGRSRVVLEIDGRLARVPRSRAGSLADVRSGRSPASTSPSAACSSSSSRSASRSSSPAPGFGELPAAVETTAALAVAFVGSVAFWWIYFDRGAELAQEIIASSDDPGRLGRSAYSYFHIPMIAGIIVAAAADEELIAHPARAGHRRDDCAHPRRAGALPRRATRSSSGRSGSTCPGRGSWRSLALAALIPVAAVTSALVLAALRDRSRRGPGRARHRPSSVGRDSGARAVRAPLTQRAAARPDARAASHPGRTPAPTTTAGTVCASSSSARSAGCSGPG